MISICASLWLSNKNDSDGNVIDASFTSFPNPAPAPDPITTYFQWSHTSNLVLPFSLQTLMVGHSLELNLIVTVWNEGEDSYGTVVNFYYPAGLSYRRVSGTQVNTFLGL